MLLFIYISSCVKDFKLLVPNATKKVASLALDQLAPVLGHPLSRLLLYCIPEIPTLLTVAVIIPRLGTIQEMCKIRANVSIR
jgi:hypothetical protein